MKIAELSQSYPTALKSLFIGKFWSDDIVESLLFGDEIWQLAGKTKRPL
jgi:hypothetical protein